MELKQTVYALDAAVIDLCLSLFPWARFRKRKGAVKLHTPLDLRGSIPSLIVVTHGKVHEVNILDELFIEAGAIYIMDRGYLDFFRLYKIQTSSAFFIIRAKSNFHYIKTYAMALLKKGYRESVKKNVPKHWFDKIPHSHVALDDAVEQGALFCNMLKENLKA